MNGCLLYKLFFSKHPLSDFNSIANNDNLCHRIEQILGKDLVSESGI